MITYSHSEIITVSDHSGMAEEQDDESSVHRVSDIPVHSTHYQNLMTLLLTTGIYNYVYMSIFPIKMQQIVLI